MQDMFQFLERSGLLQAMTLGCGRLRKLCNACLKMILGRRLRAEPSGKKRKVSGGALPQTAPVSQQSLAHKATGMSETECRQTIWRLCQGRQVKV